MQVKMSFEEYLSYAKVFAGVMSNLEAPSNVCEMTEAMQSLSPRSFFERYPVEGVEVQDDGNIIFTVTADKVIAANNAVYVQARPIAKVVKLTMAISDLVRTITDNLTTDLNKIFRKLKDPVLTDAEKIVDNIQVMDDLFKLMMEDKYIAHVIWFSREAAHMEIERQQLEKMTRSTRYSDFRFVIQNQVRGVVDRAHVILLIHISRAPK